MKNYFRSFSLGLLLCSSLFAQKPLLETRYYRFQSTPQLNAHLYLYNRAMGCKFKKVHNDSLAYYSFKDKLKQINAADLRTLNTVVLFYRDSLVSKDLLFDSLMRDLSDHLSKGSLPKNPWQVSALSRVKTFEPFFQKLYWKEIDADNKAWIAANKALLVKQEVDVIPELERIFQAKLPSEKIVVDLTCYATWAGACSYNDTYCHVLFASSHGSNKGDLATEVVFHETSHFLVDKVMEKLAALTKGKDIKKSINLWHNMIFYTTGYVMERQNEKEKKQLAPYYVQMKFEDKFPDFKIAVEACKTYWDPYIKDKSTLDDALKNIAEYVQKK